jgi:O-antigen ligase
MSAGAAASPTAPVLQLWRWVRNPAFWLPAADVFAVLTALVLPWSTSLVAIFALCWLGSTALFVDYGVYGRSLKQPICALPFAMFALAVVGTLWSDASWGERLYAISPAVKLLFLPGLFYHFERSSRGTWVFTAFLVSCVAMTLASWITAFHPAITLKPESDWVCGVFVKNYIDQSQEFTLCTIALAYPVMTHLKAKKWLPAGLLVAAALSFIVNMLFVIASRTALATMPIMLLVFALRYLEWRGVIMVAMLP